MPETLATVGYLLAAILFILSLGGLSQQETARRGNVFGIVGMVIAILITVGATQDLNYLVIGGVVAGGAVIGAIAAARVAMTSMPELVAILHSFVGLAAVLVGIGTFLGSESQGYASEAAHAIHLIEIYVGVAIGAITFTGSVIAWGKLSGKIGGTPLLIPGRHIVNLLMVVGIVGCGVAFLQDAGPEAMTLLLVNTAIASVLGIHLVMAIGGADMPVVVSLLNSYSGWAAAAAGFMLSNDLLIVTGALVGSSGAILSIIMCRGMNRSIWNVIFGGFGTGDSKKPTTKTDQGEAVATTAGEVAALLKQADRVAIIPGYGMAVARAQHSVSELTRKLRKDKVDVVFGIHPVAGRMPGHMNVLLAEADIPYDIVHELENVNPDLDKTDVVLVIGANDIVNPDALVDKSSPIYGMPQLEVWKSKMVIVLKRSLSPGYAGVPNPLFFRDNTLMFFGDANESVNDLCKEL